MLPRVLVGLGFNTATEVALFGISVRKQQTAVCRTILFPALYTVSMTLVDTTTAC